MKKVVSEKTERQKKEIEGIAESLQKIEIGGYEINLFKEMTIANPQNPGEIVQKMSFVSPYFYSISLAKVELENERISLENNFEAWFSDLASGLLGDKDFKSESAKKDFIISKNKSRYQTFQSEIQEIKNREKKLESALKSLDKYISLLQSIGAMIRTEKGVSEKENGF